MFVLRIKLKKSRLLIIIPLAVLILAFAVIVFAANADFTPVRSYATCDEAGEYPLSAGTAQERTEFFSRFGFEIDEDSTESDRVTIPAVFNDTYEKYNGLQKRIGLDLEPYQGKTVERIKFALSDGTDRQAVMLVYKDKVIGAHITSGVYGDENQPLV